MFDIKLIRERAADWLGDVGDAALARLNDAVRLVRGREIHDVFERGNDSDDELRARIRATLARGEPCPGYHLDFEPCDLCASPPEPAPPRIEARDGVEWLVAAPAECDGCAAEHEVGGPCCHHLNGEHLAVSHPNSDGDCEILARWPIEPAAGTSAPAGQDPAPHPPGGAQPGDGAPRWGWWAMAPRRRALLVDWLGKPSSNADDVVSGSVIRAACLLLSEGRQVWWSHDAGDRERLIGWLEPQRPTVDGEKLSPGIVGAACDLLRGSTPDGQAPPNLRPTGALDAFAAWFKADGDTVISAASGHVPSVARSSFLAGWTAQGERVAKLGALFAEAPPEWQELFAELDRRDPKMQAPAAVKPSHNAEQGALAGAVRMHNLLATDPLARVHLGGADDGSGLDAKNGDCIVNVCPSMQANLCAIAAEATRATGGAAPALAAGIEEQRISHGGCTRLPREMLDALGAKDGDLLWFLRSQSGGRWEAWTEADIGEHIGNGSRSMSQAEALRAAVDRMPHHVASRLTAGEARRLYAKGWKAIVAWDLPNGGRLEETEYGIGVIRPQAREEAARATTPVASAVERVPESPSGGAGAPTALPKPDAVRMGQLWRRGEDGEPFDVWTFRGSRAGLRRRVGAGTDGVDVIAADLIDGPLWQYLGMVKPERVDVGQRWRCVGVDGELVVARIDAGWDEPERAAFIGGNLGSARTYDMLGLKEWSYVGGAK